MSKSLGNAIEPEAIVKQNGADILRLWVASTDYWEDHSIGNEIVKSNVEAYRKLRNTFRYLLGNLAGFDEAERVAAADMPELERAILHRLSELDELVRKAYADYDFKRVTHTLSNFMNVDLSAFYFDIRKDTLYCDAPSSLRRRACRTVLDELFSCLTAWLAPVLCFTVEEVWLARFPSDEDSVHLRTFPEIPAEWCNGTLSEKWRKVRELRRVVTGALEVERREKRIGASLEAAPDVFVTNAELAVAMRGVDLAELAITSQASLIEGEGPAAAFRLDDVPGVAVVPKRAEGRKCARSWRVLPEVGSDPEFPDLSLRDAAAVREYDAQAARATAEPDTLMERLSRETFWGPFSFFGLAVAAASFAIDRLHKWWMLDIYEIAARGRVEVTPFFDLVMAWNKGVSYGLFEAQTALGVLILVSFALAVVFGLGLWLARAEHRGLRWPCATDLRARRAWQRCRPPRCMAPWRTFLVFTPSDFTGISSMLPTSGSFWA